jgi:tRNA-dihydrouridine synthase
MAKISHIGLRRLIVKFGGCGLLFTEMLDAKRILREDLKNKNPWTEKTLGEIPLFYQLFVSDAIIAKQAVLKLIDIDVDGIDINMGCPAPNIKKQESGIMLMQNDRNAFKIVEEIRKIYNGPLSVKMRTGFKDSIDNTISFAKSLENLGVDCIFFHPRLSSQKLKNRARWNHVSVLSKNIKIPVVGNGDVQTAPDAIEYFEKYKPQGVMISRYSAVKPWIFKEIQNLKDGVKSKVYVDMFEIWNEMCEVLRDYYSSKDAFERLVRWTEYFSKNYHFSHSFFTKVSNAKSFDGAFEEGRAFILRNQ